MVFFTPLYTPDIVGFSAIAVRTGAKVSHIIMRYLNTFAFPRLIWYFVLIALGCMNYSFRNIAIACVLIYALYVFSSFLYYLNIISFLRRFSELRRYYARKLLYIIILPLFNMFAFFVRFAGIINSIKRKSSWKTLTFTEEVGMVGETIRKDFKLFISFRRLLQKIFEKQEKLSNENV